MAVVKGGTLEHNLGLLSLHGRENVSRVSFCGHHVCLSWDNT